MFCLLSTKQDTKIIVVSSIPLPNIILTVIHIKGKIYFFHVLLCFVYHQPNIIQRQSPCLVNQYKTQF
jgi:hypothetical protein